jgi:predicted CoA-binding protein
MVARTIIDDFLAQKTLAVVGVSRDPKQFSTMAYRLLREHGYSIYPVNPLAERIEERPCYPNVAALPERVDGVVIFLPPTKVMGVLPGIADAGIRRVWLQQGTESAEAIQFCASNNIAVVHGECIMMFTEPVGFVHRAHRWVKKVTHTLPT